MTRFIRHLLMPPSFKDEEKQADARLLHWILIVLSVTEFIAAVFLSRVTPSRALIPALAVVLNILAFYAMRRGRVGAASLMLITLMWFILLISALSANGIFSSSVSLYAVLIILAAVLLREQVAFGVAVASILAVIGLTIAHRTGLIRIPADLATTPESTLTVYITLFATCGTLVYLTAQRIRSAITRIQQNEQVLAEHNQQLERQITERQQIERERDRFFTLSLDMLVTANFNGYFIYLNPAAEITLGYTLEELYTRPFVDFVHPDDVEPTYNAVKQLQGGATVAYFENRYRCKNGEYKWLAWSSYPQDGVIYAVARDMTSLKKSAEELQVSSERYRLLFENTGVPTFIYSSEGKILMINSRAAMMLGTTPENAIGKALEDFSSRQRVALFYERIQRVISTGESEMHEDVAEVGERKMYFLSNFQPLLDGQGARFAVQVIVQDVSALKQIEDQQRELALAREKSAFLSDFLATISHDLKTPLTLINTSLYLLERINDPQRQRDKIQQIGEQVELLEKFIQDILMVSRLEHLPTLRHDTLNINLLLEGIATKLRLKTEKKQVQLHLELGNDIRMVNADYDQIERAFVNLIENALNYTPSGGRIDIKTYAEDKYTIVEIIDTGIGIDEQDLPHIFDRFYRSDKARSMEQGGTGLGLAIVKKVLDMHEYPITVSSILGHGTTFRIEIPLTAAAGVG